jgi:outer membrane protein
MSVRMRVLAAAAGCCGLVAVPVRGQQPPPRLSLDDAERTALANHPQIRAAQYAAQAAGEAVRQARSVYFPSVTASLTGAQAESGSRIAAGGLNNPIILDRVATGLSVGQLITDFGRTSSLVQSSDYRADAQRETIDSRRADVLLQVHRAYFGALRAKAVLRVAEQTVRTRRVVLDQVTALASSGLKSGLDLSFARVNAAEADLLEVQARNDVQAAFTILAAAMGRSGAVEYELSDEPLPAPPPDDCGPLIAQALSNRPDLRAERFTELGVGKLADAERAAWLPAISLVAAAGTTPYRQDGLTSRYSAVGLNLTIPVTNGGMLGARRAEASLRALAETERLHDLEIGIARDVRTAWLDVQAAYRRLELAEQLRMHAGDAADLAQARYDIGLGSIVELTQAQLNLTRAEIERATAQYDCQIRSAALAFATGARR